MIDFAEIPIRVYKFNELDNKKLIAAFKEYLDGCKCCSEYPNCPHPKEQSASNALDIPHSEIVKLNQSYYNILKSVFPNNEVDQTLSWVLYVKPGITNPAVWHNHFQEEHKSKVQVSGICYLTETEHGTEFSNEFFKTETVPVLHHWYLWPSQLGHRPKEIKNDKPRWIIATNTVFK